MYWKMWKRYGEKPLVVEADNMDEAFKKARELDDGYCSAQPMDEKETRLHVMALEYKASKKANERMMNTTIWQACKILGYDANNIKSNYAVFHELYKMYYEEELAKAV